METNKKEFVHDDQYVIEVNNLKKYFPIRSGLMQRVVGHVKAVDGISFKIKRGILELRETEDGSGYYVASVPLADVAKSLESFSKSKEEADKLYVEHVR